MKYTEVYLCLKCGWIWEHEWDTNDYNNDYTQCPECFEDAEFEELGEKDNEI